MFLYVDVYKIPRHGQITYARRRRRTSNVRLPLELRSDRRETSATRVSDDLQISIFRRRKMFFGKKIGFFVFGFSLFSVDFRGARLSLTSNSNSSTFFALDGQIFRSVRPLELIFGFFTARISTSGEIYGEEQGGPGTGACLLYTSPSPRDGLLSRMPSSA